MAHLDYSQTTPLLIQMQLQFRQKISPFLPFNIHSFLFLSSDQTSLSPFGSLVPIKINLNGDEQELILCTLQKLLSVLK